MPAELTLQVFPVSIESLDARTLAMDLYLRSSDAAAPVLYRNSGIEFTNEDRLRLAEQGVKFLYVPMEQHRIYRRVLSERLDRMFEDPETHHMERARIIRASCTQMIENTLLFPRRTETIGAVTEISRQFARWASDDQGQFSYLLDMSEHDYYTATHLVNVGVACGLLVNELCPEDEELRAVMVQGGLLHDIGKRGVPKEILNKEGQLESAEWRLVKNHPQSGYHDLKAHSSVPGAVLQMVRDHHERLDGQGYPNGLVDSQIGLPARVCAVVDVYDAIFTARPYRGPTPPDQTLTLMREGSGKQFDRQVLGVWDAIVKRLIDEDPERTVTSTGDPAPSSLDNLAQRAPSVEDLGDARGAVSLLGDECRRHERFGCNLAARAVFVRQGKRCPIELGEWFTLRLADISQGGMQLRTRWPLSLNDVLDLEVSAKTGPSIKQRVRVVRIRRAENNEWVAGVCLAGRA